MLRLSKFAKLQTLPVFEDIEDWMSSPSTQNVIKMCKLLVLTAFSSHVIACFWSMIGTSTSPSWMDTYAESMEWCGPGGPNAEHAGTDTSVEDWSLLERYVAAQYWAITTMTTVRCRAFQPLTGAHLQINHLQRSARHQLPFRWEDNEDTKVPRI